MSATVLLTGITGIIGSGCSACSISSAACHGRGASVSIRSLSIGWLTPSIACYFAPALAHRKVHLSAGRASSVSWADIEAAFARTDGRPRRYTEAAPLPHDALRAITPRAGPIEAALHACVRF